MNIDEPRRKREPFGLYDLGRLGGYGADLNDFTVLNRNVRLDRFRTGAIENLCVSN